MGDYAVKRYSKEIIVSDKELEVQKGFAKLLKQKLDGLGLLACVETYGCQQNENDSERIKGILAEVGYGFTDDFDKADLIIFNTCAVRENAELKVYGKVGALKHHKRRKPSLKIGLCGCMMQQEQIAETIKKKYPHVDMIFGTHALYRLPGMLYEVFLDKRVFDVENSDGKIAEDIPSKREFSYKSGVPIMYGCNNFCTYCIVPYVRGRERSRTPEKIIEEVTALANDGVREIMLLGQNVNSYGKDLESEVDFADILEAAANVPGIRRVRFMTSHPKDITEKLISVIAKHENICKQLHLPVQSGSDRILKQMNRHYDRRHYLELVKLARSYVPDIALTSDIIVGFPGETDEDFEQTISLIKEVRYDMLFTFIYSKRTGTPAAEMEDDVPHEHKQKNFERLLEVQNEISKEINDKLVGKVFEVMSEGRSKTDPNTCSGRTDGGKLVHFEGAVPEGKFVNVKITSAKTWTLVGDII